MLYLWDMKTIAAYLKELRQSKSLPMKAVVGITNIDQGLISKYESGLRVPTDDHIRLLAHAYQTEYSTLKKLQMTERVYKLLEGEDYALDVLTAAESRLEYLSRTKIDSEFKVSSATQKMLGELDSLREEFKNLNKVSDIRHFKANEHFNLHYTYESNRIEGNTLTLSETMMVIKEGITISGKSVSEHLEAINHSEAIELMYDFVDQKEPFSQRNLLTLHALILRGINRENAGKYRGVNVRILGAEHIPPEPYLVPKLMEDYFQFYDKYARAIHPVILAAEMHERLVTIHPFIDGNGRTSRLVMNLILLKGGFPIAVLKGDQTSRLKYFQALEAVQVHGDPEPFHHLVIHRLKSSLEEHIELLSPSI